MVPWRREGTAHREMVLSSLGAGQPEAQRHLGAPQFHHPVPPVPSAAEQRSGHCPLRKRTTLFILDRRNSIHFTPQVSEDLRCAPEIKSRKTLQFIGCRDMGKRQCQ